MSSKLKPGSIASEAARLSVELGYCVTPDKIRWWRKKGYDLHDIPGLKKNLRNQERQSPPKEDEESGFSYRLITDEMVKNAKGSVPMSEVLEYLRDAWEAEEQGCPLLHAMKSEAEIAELTKRNIAWKFWTLRTVMPSVSLPPCPEWLKPMLFPDDRESPVEGIGNPSLLINTAPLADARDSQTTNHESRSLG